MKTELVQYKPVHAYTIYANEVREEGLLLSESGDWQGRAELWQTAGPAFTLLVDDEPTACGGIALLDPTYGECWLLLPKKKRGIVIFRHVLRMLRKLIDNHRFRRLQAHVVKGFEEGEYLMKRLGFEHEGWLRNFGPNGETFGLYARIF